MVESRAHDRDARPHDFNPTAGDSVSAKRAIVAALDACVRLSPEVVLTLNAPGVVVFTLRALLVPALLVTALSVRALLRVFLVLVSAALVSLPICCLCDRSAHTQRKCQSPDRNQCFARSHD